MLRPETYRRKQHTSYRFGPNFAAATLSLSHKNPCRLRKHSQRSCVSPPSGSRVDRTSLRTKEVELLTRYSQSTAWHQHQLRATFVRAMNRDQGTSLCLTPGSNSLCLEEHGSDGHVTNMAASTALHWLSREPTSISKTNPSTFNANRVDICQDPEDALFSDNTAELLLNMGGWISTSSLYGTSLNMDLNIRRQQSGKAPCTHKQHAAVVPAASDPHTIRVWLLDASDVRKYCFQFTREL